MRQRAQVQTLSLQVSSKMPAEALELIGLYPQPVRTQPSVEYLSDPRSARERAPGRIIN
jgi:hypothetical protein